MRHAKAAGALPGEQDFDRNLDDHGFAEAELVATKAADLGYRPDMIISSTAARCRQTTEAVRRAIAESIEPVFVDQLYNGTLGTYLAILDNQKTMPSIMLVGHNPTMEELLEALIGDHRTTRAIPGGFPTAGLAVLDHGEGSDAGWSLQEFLTA